MKTKILLLLFCLCSLGAWAQHSKTSSSAPGIADCNGYFTDKQPGWDCGGYNFALEYKNGKITMKDIFFYRIWGSEKGQKGTGTYKNGNLKLVFDSEDFHIRCDLKHKSKGVLSGKITYWSTGEDPYTDNVTLKRGKKPTY